MWGIRSSPFGLLAKNSSVCGIDRGSGMRLAAGPLTQLQSSAVMAVGRGDGLSKAGYSEKRSHIYCKRCRIGNSMASMPVTAQEGLGSEDCSPITTSNQENEHVAAFVTHPGLLVSRALRVVSMGVIAAYLFGSLSASTMGPLAASLSFAAPVASTEAMAVAVRSAWAGLAAGCLHTLAGADHLAALTPLTIGRTHFSASLLGALWGFGHSTGQLILGMLMVVLKDRFQQLVPALSKWGGTTVGLTLLAIGALGVYESFFEEHHDEEVGYVEKKKKESEKRGFGIATFATGIVYGLQPDALFVIIPALALPTKLAAMAFILMFVLGTVAAMGAYAGIIGATSQAIRKTNTGFNILSGAASAMAIIIGLGVLLSGWGISIPFFT